MLNTQLIGGLRGPLRVFEQVNDLVSRAATNFLLLLPLSFLLLLIGGRHNPGSMTQIARR